jgi:hypothetical protein
MLSITEWEVLQILVGKSIVHCKLQEAKREVSCTLLLELFETLTLKSPHIIRLMPLLNRMFNTESNESKNLEKLPDGDL